MPLPRVEAARYVMPLREGGSMPGLLLGSDGLHYVVKMRGAGQGPLVLVTEVIAAAIAAALHLQVPPLAIVMLPDRFGINAADPEVRDLLRTSVGANVGLRYIDGATTYDPAAKDVLSQDFAARTVWLDAFLLNVDRTARNPNLLMQRGAPWLIDHGASLYPQYTRESFAGKASLPFTAIREHVLLSLAADFAKHAEDARQMVTPDVVREAVASVPGHLWPGEREAGYGPHDELRSLYTAFLTDRLAHANIFEAEVVRAQRGSEPGV